MWGEAFSLLLAYACTYDLMISSSTKLVVIINKKGEN